MNERHAGGRRGRMCGFPVVALVLTLGLAGTVSAGAQSHAGHDAGDVPAMDADGRRLESYQVHHDMSPEAIQALKDRVALYRGMTDREINLNMSAMGPNYEWYVSDPSLRGDVGILILSHGVGEHSDRILHDALRPIAARQPMAIGFGMAMMTSGYLQSAVGDLAGRGAETIVLVQNGPTTDFNSLTRQWQYIFGLRPDASYLEVPRVESGVNFVMTPPFGGDPLITDILYDHVREVSTDPSSEVVIIVGHGPEDSNDNIADLAIIGVHADRIAARDEFAAVRIINLQDDAIAPVRKSNVKKLRRWVKKADDQGQIVIIVAIAVASHGVQTHIRADLHGLDYVFAEKGMAEHPKYMQWVEQTIDQTLATQQGRPATAAE